MPDAPDRSSAGAEPPESAIVRPRKAAFVFIFITVTLDMLAVGMFIPVLPQLVTELLGGNPVNAAAIYGLFGTVWALMQFIFSPVLGALSDRFGRRPVILISTFGAGLGASLQIETEPVRLFSETQARAIVAVPPKHLEAVLGEAEAMDVPATEVGEVGGDRLVIQTEGEKLDASVADLHEAWRTALPKALDL